MSDINVTAHGINPETGEYLSPAERKALFKKGKMGSKVDPSVFKSGVVSGVKAAQNVRQKAEADVGDFVQQERDLDELNAAAGGGGKGAIVPFTEVFSDKKPPAENVRVNVDDAPPQEAEESKESFKDALKKLLETLKRITNLKNKQKKSSKKTDKLKGKKKKEKKKERKTPGRDIFGVGRKIKGKITNVFGDIFGIFGDIIAFAALNWISDPKNRKAVKGIVTFMGHAFKFINSFVEGFIDNTLTGLSQLLGPDRSIGERFSGALKLIASFFILRWLKNPFKLVKDLRKTFKIFKTFGKFVNKILRKPIKMIQNFVQKSLNKTLGKVFMSKLFKPLRRFIIKVGGKSLFKLLGAVGRGFTKMISRIPFIGALLQFFLDVFVFKQPPARSAFKAIGSALLGAIGAAVGPIGVVLGSLGGSYLGGKLYDGWFGGGSTDKPEDNKNSGSNEGQDTQTSGGSSSNISLTNTDYMNLMIETMDKGGITDKNERIMFMAQVGHESADGLYMEEIASGAAYEGRSDLGNTEPGDGKRFKGRGYIQITGRANYRKYGPMIGVSDAVENPEKLAEPQNAAKVALAYWKDRVDRNAARKGMSGMHTVTRNINGGLNGLDDRISKFNKYSNMPLGGQGGGSGMVRPNKPAAKMKRNSVKNMYMPSMSTEFVINEKIKTNNIVEQPIVINNIENQGISVSTTGLILNKGRKPVNQVLSRL
jgi:predicted chitinase